MSFLMYFYRFPERELLTGGDTTTIVSPCDGTVLDVFLEDDAYRIVVYLSIWNVHTQWYPVSGCVLRMHHKPGEFNLAHVLEKSDFNERCSTVIQHGRGRVQVDQIAGQVARRIVNRSRVGSDVRQGEYMGMIKLSSRVDILVPSTVQVSVKRNDRVWGNRTELARWN
jgi:phosphatidylserine decarboxylase